MAKLNRAALTAIAAPVLAGIVLAIPLLTDHQDAVRRPSPAPHVLTARPALTRLTPPRERRARVDWRSRTVDRSDPEDVARLFLTGWLGCAYHQAPCSRIAETLPAYAIALSYQQGRSLPTPTELRAHPSVLSLRQVRSCPRADIELATYRDGAGGRFQLHINLVREPGGWEVFDVAEAPPHIPLPKPLSDGPGGC